MLDTSDPRLAWLELYDPRRVRAMKQELAGDLMIAAVAVPESVPANSIIGGADASSALALDRQIANARGRNPGITGCPGAGDLR